MTASPLFALVYSSVEAEALDEAHLRAILESSRAANHAVGITGLLLHRGERFIQFLEGPERAVRTLVGKLATDSRHTRLRVLLEEPIERRQFGEWTMGYESDDDSTTPEGFRRSFDDLDAGDDDRLMAQAARDLTLWFRARSASAERASAATPSSDRVTR